MKIRILGEDRSAEAVTGAAKIVVAPEEWYEQTADGRRVLLTDVVARHLVELMDSDPRNAGLSLHTADVLVTSDIEEIRAFGLDEDCANCMAGVDRTAGYLAEHPGAEVAVVKQWWTGTPLSGNVN